MDRRHTMYCTVCAEYETGGYLTVYLAMSLTILLTLILTLIDGSRISAERMRSEIVTDIGLNAAFSEYNRELYKQYGLIFIDTGYGSEHPSEANTEEHLRQYLKMNYETPPEGIIPGTLDMGGHPDIECGISECGYASDDNGAVLERQIADYMKYVPSGWVTEKLLPDVGMITGAGVNGRDVESERSGNQSVIDEMSSQKVTDENGKEQEIVLDNPADAAGTAGSIGVLSMTAPKDKVISQKVTDPSCYISHRQRNRGTGLCSEEKKCSGSCSRVLLEEYLFRTMGCYDSEKDDSVLKYQLEYILCGNGSDWDNLEGTAERMLIWREAVNAAYVFSDAEKTAEAEAMAAALSAVTMMPELLEPVKISILFAWSFLESMQDMKVLMNGGKEPAVKTASSWQTDLEDIVNIGGSLRDSSGSGGLDYKEYLAAMLYLENREEMLMRAMDIMEMDVRQTQGNMYFCMDRCMDNLMADVRVDGILGHGFNVRRRYGYYYK